MPALKNCQHAPILWQEPARLSIGWNTIHLQNAVWYLCLRVNVIHRVVRLSLEEGGRRDCQREAQRRVTAHPHTGDRWGGSGTAACCPRPNKALQPSNNGQEYIFLRKRRLLLKKKTDLLFKLYKTFYIPSISALLKTARLILLMCKQSCLCTFVAMWPSGLAF